MFKATGLVALAVALAPLVDAAAPEWGQVSPPLCRTRETKHDADFMSVLVRWYWLDRRHQWAQR